MRKREKKNDGMMRKKILPSAFTWLD